MDDHFLIPRQRRARDQIVIRAAIVNDDRRLGIEKSKIADEVENALWAFMYQASENISQRLRRWRRGSRNRWKALSQFGCATRRTHLAQPFNVVCVVRIGRSGFPRFHASAEWVVQVVNRLVGIRRSGHLATAGGLVKPGIILAAPTPEALDQPTVALHELATYETNAADPRRLAQTARRHRVGGYSLAAHHCQRIGFAKIVNRAVGEQKVQTAGTQFGCRA